MTNADKIRSMSNEELAKMLSDSVYCSDCPGFDGGCSRNPSECHALWLGWLDQEVEA